MYNATAGFATDGTLAGIAPTPNSVGPRPAEFVLPLNLVRSIAKLIAYHERPREKPLDRAIKLFIGTKPENKKFLPALRPAMAQWLKVTGWFRQ
jgi:hypothetical protein